MTLILILCHLQIYSKTSIIGKRLFQDNFIEQDEHVGTRELPVPIADEVVVRELTNLFCFRFFFVLTKVFYVPHKVSIFFI